MKPIRSDHRQSVRPICWLGLVAVTLLATGCASINKGLEDLDRLTAAGHEATQKAGQVSDNVKGAVGEIKGIRPGGGNPTTRAPQKPATPAEVEPTEESGDDDEAGSDGTVDTPGPITDPETPPPPPQPAIKTRLIVDAESPLECTEGEAVELSCHVTTPTGAPVEGATVIFQVRDSAGSRDLGIARTDAQGMASRSYTPSYNFKGRKASVTLRYMVRIEDSRRWYATRAGGQIALLRAGAAD